MSSQEQTVNVILAGNVVDKLRELVAAGVKVKCIITSSPYFRMRFYGTALQVWDGSPECDHSWKEKTSRQHAGRGDGQKGGKYSEQDDYPDLVVKSADCTLCGAWLGELGQEATRDKFLEHLWLIGDLLFQLLDDDGTLWFNIGDKRDDDGSLYNVPHAFAEGMIRRGWKLIDDVVWFKRSVLPQSDPTKFTPDYEPIFHFAKRDAPTFYANAVLGVIQREEPPGTDDGVEGIDWVWSPQKHEPKRKVKELREVEVEVNGELVKKQVWHVKRSLWAPYTYFHETQYRPYSEDSLKQIEKAYEGKSKKHEMLAQTTLFGSVEGVQNASDTKRSIIESIKSNVLPLYGGKKADGYGNGSYSGEAWEPANPDDGEAFGSYERTVWDIIPARFAEAHFATFPIELVQRCLKSSCPEQVCTKCGLGLRKMYSEERKATRPGRNVNSGKSGNPGDPNEELHKSDLSRKREQVIRRVSGIMKCKCEAPTVPGIVLDPFMGSGTTAEAAIGLARNWLGIELNPEYIKLAMQRLMPLLEQGKL